MMKFAKSALHWFALGILSQANAAIVADFDDLPTGTVITKTSPVVYMGGGESATFYGVQTATPANSVTLTLFNSNGPDPLAPLSGYGFPLGNAGGDPDLLYLGGGVGWDGTGNLNVDDVGGDERLDNLLIVAENTLDNYNNAQTAINGTWSGTADGLLDIPDDAVGNSSIRIEITRFMTTMILTQVDFDANTDVSISFFRRSDPMGAYTFAGSLLDVALADIDTSAFAPDNTDVFFDGDNSADRIEFNLYDRVGEYFDHIEIKFNGDSGGFGDFTFIPEPSSVLLITFGALYLTGRRVRQA